MKAVAALLAFLLPAAAIAGPLPQPFERGSWSALREAHRGHAMIVHFWGVTCGPCLAELPDWGKFAARHRDLELVMIDADPVAVAPADIAAMLDKAGLDKVESWRFADSFTERLEFEIDPQWHGELPYTLLIKGDGAVEPVLGAADFAALQRWVAQ
jgi:thiol-disulfide isomerase/thioredoxin